MIKNTRICIVGAGAAGLSTGYYLRQKGYNPTIFEKSNRVGGKCESVTYDGNSYELGAFTITPSYTNVLDIARNVGAKTLLQPDRKAFDGDSSEILPIMEFLLKDNSFFDLSLDIVKYLTKLIEYNELWKPGFAGAAKYPELSVPFLEWLRIHNLESLTELFRLPVKDMGYGNLSEISALFVLKYMNVGNFLTLLLFGMGFKSLPSRFKEGYGRLWERVSWDLDVRLEVCINKINRKNYIEVTDSNGETHEFDVLILACPLEQSLPFLDYSAEEKLLFDSILYNDYYVTLCRAETLPPIVFDGLKNLKPGRPWEIMRAWENSNVCGFYSMGSGLTTEKIDEYIREETERLFKGKILSTETRRLWKYFPHYSEENIKNGYYDRLEALQGKLGSFYTGGILSFETVEHVVSYSHSLVKANF